jgi:hypothetical protein
MKIKLFRIVLVIATLALGSLACGLLSSIPSLPSSVPSLPTAAGNGNSGTGSSNVLLQDDFSDSNSGWGTGTDANKSVEYANSSLEFKVFKTFDFVYSTPTDTDYQGVHIEVTIKPNASETNTTYGILCDQQVTSNAFYYFALRNTGDYGIAKSSIAKDDVFLTNNNSWATSKLIPAGATSYTLGADCGSGLLTLYVNGKRIDSVTDSTYTKGKIGLFTWSDKRASSSDVNFENFVMTSLK